MDAKTQAMFNLLASQRNQALDAFASAVGEIAERDEKIAALEKELESTKPVATPEHG